MMALTIWQPWAWLIVHGGKDVENRGWKTSHRGPLLIHAGQRLDSQAVDRLYEADGRLLDLRFGAIIGMVDLVDIVRDSRSRWANPGQYHWLLANPRPFEFEDIKGQRRLWEYRLPGEPEPAPEPEQIGLDV